MNPSPLANLDLRDIHAAMTPDFWPPAPGWWLLTALVAMLLAAAGWQLLKLWRRRQLQARILAELSALDSHSPAEIAVGISTLLRRVALMGYARSEVAPLSGDAWLRFLDSTGGDGAFSNGVGNVLATAPYAAHDVTNVNANALLALAREWIKQQRFVGLKHRGTYEY